jgi:poly-gamma-glutamate synthesis protein (capsule biosynthesis protein)
VYVQCQAKVDHNNTIVYSLGNFVFDQDFSKETREGLALKLTVDGTHVSIEPIPIQIDLSQPRMAEGDERVRRLAHLAEISDPSLREQIQRGKVDITLP